MPLVYIVHRVPFFPPLDRRSEFSSPIFFGSPDPLNKRKIIFYSIFEIPEAFIERIHQKIVQKPSKKATKKIHPQDPIFPPPPLSFWERKQFQEVWILLDKSLIIWCRSGSLHPLAWPSWLHWSIKCTWAVQGCILHWDSFLPGQLSAGAVVCRGSCLPMQL